MNLLPAVALYILLLHAAGLGFLALLNPREDKRSVLLTLGSAGLIGAVLILLLGLACHLLRASAFPWAAAAVSFLLPLAAHLIKRPLLPGPGLLKMARDCLRSLRFHHSLLLAFILAQAGYILFSALWRPVAMNDDWAQWSLNAKLLYYHGLFDSAYFASGNLAYYPQLIMQNEILLCRFHGAWDDFLCNAPHAVWLLDLLLVFLGWMACRSGRTAALLAGFLFLSIPMYIRAGFDGTGEIPLSLYLALGAILLLEAGPSPRFLALLPAGIALAGAAAVKSEGLYSAAALALAWGISLLRPLGLAATLRRLLPLALSLMLVSLPWLLILRQAGLTGDGIQETRFTSFSLAWAADPESYRGIFRQITATLVNFSSMALLGPYLLLALLRFALFDRADAGSRFLLLALLTVAAVYAFGAYATGWPDQYARLLTHLAGLVLLFVFHQGLRLAKPWARQLAGAGPEEA